MIGCVFVLSGLAVFVFFLCVDVYLFCFMCVRFVCEVLCVVVWLVCVCDVCCVCVCVFNCVFCVE